MRRHAAAFVWAGPGRWFAPGRLVVDPGGRIVSVEAHRGRVQHEVLIPGLVDAHVHLQLAPLARPVRDFVPWIRAVLAQRADATPGEGASNVRVATRTLAASGCTAVGEVDSDGTSVAGLRASGHAGRCYQEVLGFDLGRAGARRLVAARDRAATSRCWRGISPHAPYSVSSALIEACRRSRRAMMIHVAETEEEVEFLRAGRGPLRALLEDLGRLPASFRPIRGTAVSWLSDHRVLGPRTALVHCQHLTSSDVEAIAATGAPIVVCPGTIRFFRRDPPPVGDWLSRGIPVALGTDSRASRDGDLDMLAELRAARALWPGLAPEAVLAMATAAGGQALARPSVGSLRRGGAADFIALRCAARTERSVAAALTSGAAEVTGIWLRGRRRRASADSVG